MMGVNTVHRLANWLHQRDAKGFRFLAHHLPRLCLPAPKGLVCWPTLHGFELYIEPADDTGVEHVLYYMGSYERGTLHLIEKLLRPGDHFVDVGANIGLMSIFAARLTGPQGKVTAFEPHPHTCGMLLKNVQHNNLPHITVHRMALGASPGMATLTNDPEGNRGAASLLHPTDAASVQVELTSLDAIFAQHSEGTATRHPDLIKMDVEGFEAEVIKGGTNLLRGPDAPALIVECSAREAQQGAAHTSSLYQLLNQLEGYRLFKSTKNKAFVAPLQAITDATHMPEHDNVYALQERHMHILRNEITSG